MYRITFDFSTSETPLVMSIAVDTIAEVRVILAQYGIEHLTEIDTCTHDQE